jgi:hypothetical protein
MGKVVLKDGLSEQSLQTMILDYYQALSKRSEGKFLKFFLS